MKFFLDTAHIDEIKKANDWGILDGVTTNPSHVASTGKKFVPLVEDICELMGDRPVSAEVVATDPKGMLKEAREINKIANNIVVKVPTIPSGIQIGNTLKAEGIKTNYTLVFSASQALLTAKIGATYISPFVGRLDNVSEFGMEVVGNIRTILDNSKFDSQIILSATRHPLHVLEGALIGADVCTMRFDIMEMLFDHPMTDIGLEMFLKDWEKVPQ